jgi:predicted RNase H-like nuclease (RuvC/YqgF family)
LQNERQGRLLFSLEDDLDYVILKDDYLYSKYLKELESILQKLDNTLIDQTFEKVHNELLPFYNISEVIEQSKYDKEPTDLVTLTNNLAEKKERITNRLNWLRSEVAKQLDKSTPKISAKTMNIQSVK